ncbi:MAG: extracellular solute-binding protein [Candidatus Paceibacterota bacterium]
MKGLSIFQITLLAVFAAIAVAAVLIFAFAVGGSTSASTGPVKIWGTLDATAFNTVIRQAVESDTRLSQVIYVQKEEKTFITEVTDALASGQGPDLILLRQDYAYSQAGKLIPIPYAKLSQTQFANTFVESANTFLSENGVLAIPLAVDPLVLYWNRDMLSTAGFSKPPQYWDELYVMARTMTKRSDNGAITKSAIAFGEYVNVDNAKDILSLLILQAGGAITARDNSGRVVPALSPKTGDLTQATPSALRFYTEFADPSKDDYTWNRSLADARQAFATGDLAMYVGYASEQPLILRMNPNLNFAAAPIPQRRGAPRATDVGHTYGFATPRTSGNPSGAITVAYVLASTDTSKNLSTALGIPSARRDVLAQPAQGEDELFNKLAIITRAWIDPDPAKTDDIFRGMIEDTTSGASLLSEAVTRAEQQLEHILGL